MKQLGDLTLKRAAVQVAGLFVEAIGKKFKKKSYLPPLLPHLLDIIRSTSSSSLPWDVVYYALTALEKIFISIPNLLTHQSFEVSIFSFLFFLLLMS